MLHVDFEKYPNLIAPPPQSLGSISHVDFKKMLCRRANFNGCVPPGVEQGGPVGWDKTGGCRLQEEQCTAAAAAGGVDGGVISPRGDPSRGPGGLGLNARSMADRTIFSCSRYL